MAYKFQLGAARLSGSTTFEQPLVGEQSVSAQSLSSSAGLQVGGTVELDGVADADADVAADKFYILDATDGLMKTEDIGDLMASVAGAGLSESSDKLEVNVDDTGIEIDGGDLSLKDGGVVTAKLAADAVDSDKLADDSVGSEHIKDNAVVQAAMADDSVGTAELLDLNVTTAKIAADAIVGSKIADDSVDSEHIVDGSIDLAHMSADSVDSDQYVDGSVDNVHLANDSITLTAGAGMATIGEVDLGASITVAVDGVLEDLDTLGAAAADGEFIVATGAGAFAYESGNTARTSLGLGTGSVVSFNQVTASVGFFSTGTSQFGTVAANTYNGDSVAVTGITGSLNNSITAGDGIVAFTFNNGDGDKTVALASTVGGDGLGFDTGVLSLDLNELTPATVDVSADSFAIIDADGDSSKKESIADLVTAMAGAGLTATSGQLSVTGNNVTSKEDGDTLAEGYNFFGTVSAAATVTLPASPSIGDVVTVKAKDGVSATNYIKISRAGLQFIDGELEARIESEYGAVSMVYVASNDWRII